LAVALVAAALGDSLVESIANSGLTGAGYRDDDHLSVLPTLLAGSVLVLEILRSGCLAVLRRGTRLQRRAWLAGFAKGLIQTSLRRDLAFVLVLQFAALFAMESVEQLLAGGRLLGGTAWLGGPVAFSLLTHALLGAGCLFVLGRLGRVLLALFAAFVVRAVDALLCELARARAQFVACRRDGRLFRLAHTLGARRCAERAPPLVAFAPA
jgi:hypothetical protein